MQLLITLILLLLSTTICYDNQNFHIWFFIINLCYKYFVTIYKLQYNFISFSYNNDFNRLLNEDINRKIEKFEITLFTLKII